MRKSAKKNLKNLTRFSSFLNEGHTIYRRLDVEKTACRLAVFILSAEGGGTLAFYEKKSVIFAEFLDCRK